ncbi:Arabinogalactan protein 41 [Ranunculus cassubicifolius]
MNSSMKLRAIASLLVLFLALLQLSYAQEGIAPSPAPTSNGNTIDQGIAYLLMLVALAITYMFH